jgi:hypothetical protein
MNTKSSLLQSNKGRKSFPYCKHFMPSNVLYQVKLLLSGFHLFHRENTSATVAIINLSSCFRYPYFYYYFAPAVLDNSIFWFQTVMKLKVFNLLAQKLNFASIIMGIVSERVSWSENCSLQQIISISNEGKEKINLILQNMW